MIEQAKNKLTEQIKGESNQGIVKIINYVIGFVTDEMFAAKVLNEKKSVKEMFQYILSEAKKLAMNGCCMMDDADVYNLAIHYFDEESLKFTQVTGRTEVKTSVPSKEVPKATSNPKIAKSKADYTPLSFDLFGEDGGDAEADFEDEEEHEEE